MSCAWRRFTPGREMLSGGRFGLLLLVVVAPWHGRAEDPEHLQQPMAFNSSDILATEIKFVFYVLRYTKSNCNLQAGIFIKHTSRVANDYRLWPITPFWNHNQLKNSDRCSTARTCCWQSDVPLTNWNPLLHTIDSKNLIAIMIVSNFANCYIFFKTGVINASFTCWRELMEERQVKGNDSVAIAVQINVSESAPVLELIQFWKLPWSNKIRR